MFASRSTLAQKRAAARMRKARTRMVVFAYSQNWPLSPSAPTCDIVLVRSSDHEEILDAHQNTGRLQLWDAPGGPFASGRRGGCRRIVDCSKPSRNISFPLAGGRLVA